VPVGGQGPGCHSDRFDVTVAARIEVALILGRGTQDGTVVPAAVGPPPGTRFVLPCTPQALRTDRPNVSGRASSGGLSPKC